MSKENTVEKEQALNQVQDKFVDWMNGLESIVTDNSDKLQEIAGDAIDLGLWVIRIEGISNLLFGFIALSVIIISFVIMKKQFNYAHIGSPKNFLFDVRQTSDPSFYKIVDAQDDGSIAFVFLLAAVNIIAAIVMLIHLSIWNWIMVFMPELYIAKQLTEKVLGIGG